MYSPQIYIYSYMRIRVYLYIFSDIVYIYYSLNDRLGIILFINLCACIWLLLLFKLSRTRLHENAHYHGCVIVCMGLACPYTDCQINNNKTERRGKLRFGLRKLVFWLRLRWGCQLSTYGLNVHPADEFTVMNRKRLKEDSISVKYIRWFYLNYQ